MDFWNGFQFFGFQFVRFFKSHIKFLIGKGLRYRAKYRGCKCTGRSDDHPFYDFRRIFPPQPLHAMVLHMDQIPLLVLLRL